MSDEPPRPFPGCPHADIRDCPLYVAAHDPDAGGLSCWDQHIEYGGCAADRLWPYERGLERLRAAFPRIVAEREFAATGRRIREQRQRNMRAAGIH